MVVFLKQDLVEVVPLVHNSTCIEHGTKSTTTPVWTQMSYSIVIGCKPIFEAFGKSGPGAT